MVERGSMAGEGEGELGEVVDVDLRLVSAGAHEPFTILTGSNAIAGFLKFEVLKYLDSVLIFSIVLQTALPSSSEPVGEWASS